MGMLFFWEKQLASLRHLFPGRKAHPHPLDLALSISPHERIVLCDITSVCREGAGIFFPPEIDV
jgi:hypothetical protein